MLALSLGSSALRRPAAALRCISRCMSETISRGDSSPSPLAPDSVKTTHLRTGYSGAGFRQGVAADKRGSSWQSPAFQTRAAFGGAPPPAPLSQPVSRQEHVLVLQQLLSPATASSAELKRVQLAEASVPGKRHDFDTGSTSVQLLRLCSRIKQLKDHLAVHKKDHVTARSLNALVEQRYSLLAYLKRTESSKYQSMLEQCFTPKELRILANDKWRKYFGN